MVASEMILYLVGKFIDRYHHWKKASPWLYSVNPRDLIMPVDGDDGFYPTGNELVFYLKLTLCFLICFY